MRLYINLIICFIFNNGFFFLNAQTIQQQLSSFPGISYKQIPNVHYKEYYEIFIEQPVDHDDPSSAKFLQRLFLGFNSTNLSTILNTDGYAIDYASKPDYQNELAQLLNSNLLTIEHRYFGKSIPDPMNYNYLTVKQAAGDIHEIRKLFSAFLTNNWIASGISKGGQAALSYKVFYPNDVSATIVYGTAVKLGLNENKIDSVLTFFERTPCGNNLEQIRTHAFKNKRIFIPLFRNYCIQKGVSLKQFDSEIYFDYLLLELSFSFRQNGMDCTKIPSILSENDEIFNFLISVVPPRFYQFENLQKLKPAFYMFYHELGYYEYNTGKYLPYLSHTDYSNKNLALHETKIEFDQTYLNTLNKFLKTESAKNIIFIYGENDPWASMQNTGYAKKEIIENGSHKSRIANMKSFQKESLIKHLDFLLKKNE